MFELRLWKKRTKEINANRKTTSGKARANDQPSNIAHKHSPKEKKKFENKANAKVFRSESKIQ